MKNKVKPTEKQRSTFAHIKRGLALKDAMIEAGYSEKTAINTKANFIEREGVKPLIQEYRDLLIKNGLSLDMLSEIQIEGLFDQNGAVRLGYLKETKKDLGLSEDQVQVTNNVLVIPSELMEKYGITPNTEGSSKG